MEFKKYSITIADENGTVEEIFYTNEELKEILRVIQNYLAVYMTMKELRHAEEED